MDCTSLEAMDPFLNLTLTPLTIRQVRRRVAGLICERFKILRDGCEDELVMGADEAAVYEFCIQLHRTRHVDDATFKRVFALFGERGVVERIGVSGYYAAVSMTLNVAQVMPPEGTTRLFSNSGPGVK